MKIGAANVPRGDPVSMDGRILSRRPAIGIKSSSVACFIFGLLLPNENLIATYNFTDQRLSAKCTN